MKRLFFMLMTLVLVSTLLLPAFPAAAQNSQSGGGLSKHDHELLDEALVQGKTTVTLLIASLPGNNKSVASNIIAFGGTVRFQDDSLDYLRAIVPIDAAEKIAQLS